MEFQGRPGFLLRNRRIPSDQGVCLPREWGILLPLLDGRRSLDDICSLAAGMTRATIERVLLALDGIYLLDNERSRARRKILVEEFRQSHLREPICAGGVYSAEPDGLARQLDLLYTQDGGPGGPKPFAPTGAEPRLVLSPHIDYRRGRHSFAWAFKELAERSSATIYVIVATSHYSFSRFVLTLKDFRTPFGLTKTHRDFVDLLVDVYGREAFDDEYAHHPEHSIELMLPLLHHARQGRPDYTIVPLLVGSFGDTIDEGSRPCEDPAIARMISALRQAEASCGEKVCYVVSGDLAHLGPKFGDRHPVTSATSDSCRAADHRLLEEAASADPDRLFGVMHQERDERRICGFPPLYVALSAARPAPGRVVCYDQFVDRSGSEIVSFASMVYDG
jgi:AmmeMemoRadiSam system protein B